MNEDTNIDRRIDQASNELFSYFIDTFRDHFGETSEWDMLPEIISTEFIGEIIKSNMSDLKLTSQMEQKDFDGMVSKVTQFRNQEQPNMVLTGKRFPKYKNV